MRADRGYLNRPLRLFHTAPRGEVPGCGRGYVGNTLHGTNRQCTAQRERGVHLGFYQRYSEEPFQQKTKERRIIEFTLITLSAKQDVPEEIVFNSFVYCRWSLIGPLFSARFDIGTTERGTDVIHTFSISRFQ